ncbi:bacteriocin [Lactobacillus sp. CBA3605]|uniref:bacteriocin n=1 Tax=Lactobacillus sp. CBA3605 TaxID=2099788 RepID=UPI00131A1516|nr:bacteriocin [Lactobacillus sp. CBA3605]
MNKKLFIYANLSDKDLATVSGGSLGNIVGHILYFTSKGMREYGKTLNKAYTKKH